ncbi:phage gp6-like head-tail connector family protein (plasmid) [Anoxybacillus sp. B7M1]|uniref:phage head-tail connector protein n=1 Tax=Anoxybacillus sp. B7M1 TaxID=1490057 RepID=UPI0005CDB8B2|nr:phage head-tail connector protein [Anoxybacillus sp. B7M1]ANB66177.1 phage gp6-like head-tail connector family protein [Anoxybacillus sp. B7M1]
MQLADNALTTLEEVKSQLEINDGSLDNKIIRAINVASDRIERMCRRSFGLQNYVYQVKEPARMVFLPNLPVVEILSINDSPATDVDFDSESGMIQKWFCSGAVIRYRAGYVLPKDATDTNKRTLPYDIEEACIRLVSYMVKETEGVGMKLGDFSIEIEAKEEASMLEEIRGLLEPYRMIRI